MSRLTRFLFIAAVILAAPVIAYSQQAGPQNNILHRLFHISVGSQTAPTAASCGTTPTVIGNDTAGLITEGGSATGCIVTFNQAYAAAPFCTVSPQSTTVTATYTLTTTNITLSNASASNAKFMYQCVGQNGG
jgi:hypothetical protein